MPGRICQQCKPRAYNAEQGCDSFEDAYAYILERLRHVALPAFRGVSSLNSFVYLCLHDHRWWSSLVQKETGKVKLPVVLRNSPEITQKVFYRRRWGWDSEEIARDLRLSVSSVESISDQIDEMLQGAGVRLQDRKLTFVSLSGRLSDEEGLEREYEPQAPESGIEIRAEAMQFWSSLTRQDRELLRLVVESENTTKEIAAAMGLTVTQVYNSIYRLRRQMPDWFKNPASERKTPQSSVQTIAEVSTDEMS
jgi:DNA-binding CsgD family transcriptional regulator